MLARPCRLSFRLPLSALLCALAPSGALAQQYSSGLVELPIPDNAAIASTILVQGGPPTLASVRVRINISHSWDADLDLVLAAPGATSYVHLCSDVGGSADDFSDTLFAPGAGEWIHSAGGPFRGTFRPEGGPVDWNTLPAPQGAPLAGLESLAGTAADGAWTLFVRDDRAGQTGVLHEWAIIFAGPGAPTSPAAVLTLSPAAAPVGANVVAQLAVSAGQSPPSTGLVASLDTGALGAGTLALRDDGVAPDAAPGDLVFACVFSPAPGSSVGAHTVAFSLADAQQRASQGAAGFMLLPPASPDDLCENATVIPAGLLPYVSPARTIGGNAEGAEADILCAAGGAHNAVSSVWFRFDCPRTAEYSISTALPGTTVADTVLALYDGSCGAPRALVCDDDGGGNYKSVIRTTLTEGVSYYIQAARWAPGAPGGAIALSIESGAAGACCTGTACEVLTREACDAAGGVYLGDGVACAIGGGLRIEEDRRPFENIGTSGTPLPLGDDDSAPAPIGFDFPFMGGTFSTVHVSSNGLLTFGGPTAAFANGPIPSAAAPNLAAYALWDDLDPSAGGSVSFASRGTLGIDRRFIVQWTAVPQYGVGDANTFQAVLDQNGDISYRYAQISAFSDDDATVGVEDGAGTLAASARASLLRSGAGLLVTVVPGGAACDGCGWRTDGCGADYNNDDGIDGDDVIAFFRDWDNGIGCADVDSSGGVDGDDVISFFESWDVGGC